MGKKTEQPVSLPLKQVLTEEISQPELSTAQLDDLMQMQAEVLEERAVPKPDRSHTGWFAAAAAVLLTLSILFWQTGNPGVEQDIAREVVENHLKLKPMDVQTESIGEIRRYFTQLDFSPAHPGVLDQQFALASTQIVGGRYCSVQGVTAAQIRYRGEDEKLRTLYEVGYDPDVFGSMPDAEKGEPPKELMVKGLKVTLWVEKGLLMALVSDI